MSKVIVAHIEAEVSGFWDHASLKLSGAWRSLTIWFNTLLGLAITFLPIAQENLPGLQQYLPADLYKYAVVALAVGNLLLRTFATSSSLEGKAIKAAVDKANADAA